MCHAIQWQMQMLANLPYVFLLICKALSYSFTGKYDERICVGIVVNNDESTDAIWRVVREYAVKAGIPPVRPPCTSCSSGNRSDQCTRERSRYCQGAAVLGSCEHFHDTHLGVVGENGKNRTLRIFNDSYWPKLTCTHLFCPPNVITC